MVTVLWVVCIACALLMLLRFRTSAVVAGVFVLMVLIPRIVALTYIDLYGPVYAEQLDREIGGTGSSMPLLATSVLLFILALAFIFRPAILRRLLDLPLAPHPRAVLAGRLAFIACTLFIVLLYADLLMRGVIPLFDQMERYDYATDHAGPFHLMLFEYGFLFATVLGTFFVYPRLIGRGFDLRFMFLLFSLFGYFILTGHRFSAFYGFSCFFFLPLSALFFLKNVNALPSFSGQQTLAQRLLTRKSSWIFACAAMAIMLSGVIFNSLTNVRNYENPEEKLVQRVLIQPAELWWVTWDSMFNEGEETQELAWELMFSDPLASNRNTGIQYLMVKALGYNRTQELLNLGSQYAGGYPEVLFELVGPYAALPLALVFCLITALLLRLIVLSVCRGNFITVVMGVYVFYGFTLLFVGGMLNFLITPSYFVKIIALVLACLIEQHLYKRRRHKQFSMMKNRPFLSRIDPA